MASKRLSPVLLVALGAQPACNAILGLDPVAGIPTPDAPDAPDAPDLHDEDGDGTANSADLCPHYSDDQANDDGDALGDACEVPGIEADGPASPYGLQEVVLREFFDSPNLHPTINLPSEGVEWRGELSGLIMQPGASFSIGLDEASEHDGVILAGSGMFGTGTALTIKSAYDADDEPSTVVCAVTEQANEELVHGVAVRGDGITYGDFVEPQGLSGTFIVHLFLGNNAWCFGGSRPGADVVVQDTANTSLDANSSPRRYFQIALGANSTTFLITSLQVYRHTP